MTTPDLSVEMFGWLSDVLVLLTAMVAALCGLALVAVCGLCVEGSRHVRVARPFQSLRKSQWRHDISECSPQLPRQL